MSLLPGIPVASPIVSDARARAVQTAQAATAQAATAKSASAAKQTDGTATRTVENELGRDAFLQLLVLQMRNQDPLDPQDNQQMLAQLAQFSALEQQTNLNSSFEFLSGSVDQLNFISASQLLGRTVSGVDLNGMERQGVVESVHLDGSVVVLTVDGELMSMAGVQEIDFPSGSVPSEGTSKGRY